MIGNSNNGSDNEEEVFYIIMQGKTCLPGVGIVPSLLRQYLYRRDTGIIIQKLPPIRGWPELLVIEKDAGSIKFLKRVILDPDKEVKRLSGEEIIMKFDRLTTLIKKELKEGGHYIVSKALFENIVVQAELII